MNNLSPMLLCDFYKISHREQYPEKTEVVYSTWTPRASKIPYIDKVVAFGFHAFIQNYLIEFFNENFFDQELDDVIFDYKRVLKHCLGVEDPPTKHIEDLWRLQYLPLKIKAVPEGTKVPLRVPMLTIENTDPRFYWLTNYIETLASCEMWLPCTSATLAYEFRKVFERYAKETVGSIEGVDWQGHDFSMRGMSSLQASMSSGAGHLLSFTGTDSIPALSYLEYFYGADMEKELIGASVPATEHSVQCAYGDDEVYIERMFTTVVPKGLVSIVSDGYDFWNVIENVLPKLKSKIMARDGKVVIRPDSGDPVKIICGDPNGRTLAEQKGAIECLWDTFGGTLTARGYKLLDSHIGLIYGDAITLERANEICKQLKIKGFASTNVVLGIGSFTYQYVTRDTFGFALKSTLCVIDGVEKQIFKDPKTDDGIKRSQKGKVIVYKDKGELKYQDGFSLNYRDPRDLLSIIFEDGTVNYSEKLSNIRTRIRE